MLIRTFEFVAKKNNSFLGSAVGWQDGVRPEHWGSCVHTCQSCHQTWCWYAQCSTSPWQCWTNGNYLKGTVSGISRDPPCKDGIARFTTIPLADQWIHSIPVVNLNSNRTCPVCTGLPDNRVYWPDPMVQYVALNRLTYDRGQFSWVPREG